MAPGLHATRSEPNFSGEKLPQEAPDRWDVLRLLCILQVWPGDDVVGVRYDPVAVKHIFLVKCRDISIDIIDITFHDQNISKTHPSLFRHISTMIPLSPVFKSRSKTPTASHTHSLIRTALSCVSLCFFHLPPTRQDSDHCMEKSGGHWLRRAPPGSVSELVHEFWQSSLSWTIGWRMVPMRKKFGAGDQDAFNFFNAWSSQAKRREPTSMNAPQISANLEYLWDVLMFQHPSENIRTCRTWNHPGVRLKKKNIHLKSHYEGGKPFPQPFPQAFPPGSTWHTSLAPACVPLHCPAGCHNTEVVDPKQMKMDTLFANEKIYGKKWHVRTTWVFCLCGEPQPAASFWSLLFEKLCFSAALNWMKGGSWGHQISM